MWHTGSQAPDARAAQSGQKTFERGYTKMKTNHERVINTTKQNQKIARAAAETAYSHRDWTYETLWDAYEKPSFAKAKAWKYCVDLCREMGGFDMVISARNCMVFSVVFTFVDNETGVVCYAYITRDYDRFCEA
jgi:hypothetical protein